MKKRSKPTALIFALVLFLGAAFGINAYQSGFLRMAAQSQQDSQPGQDAPRKTESASDMAGKAQDAAKEMQNRAKAMGKMHAPPEAATPGQPLMAVAPEKAKAYKPTPNDSSISTQWYDDEAMQNLPKTN